MSGFSFPEVPPEEMLRVFVGAGVVPETLKVEQLLSPSAEMLYSIFSNFFASIDPLGAEDDSADIQLDFSVLEALDNPEHHAEAIGVVHMYHKIRRFLEEIRITGFTLKDFLRPEPRRTAQFLSALVNFLYFQEDKLNLLKPIVNEYPNTDERRAELKNKINELNEAIADHQLKTQMEEPIVQQVDTEIRDLKQMLQNFHKQQLALKAQAMSLTEKRDSINEKISQSDFELVKVAQENSKLLSMIVQSPDKLQSALEEKKAALSLARNSEKLAMQYVQEKTATLEVYSKAFEKLSRHLSKVQALQEKMAAAKSVEKEVKALKVKLSDESVSIMSLEAKLVERDRKAKQLEELLKATEKERDSRAADELHRLSTLKAEIEWQLKCLEPRERQVEAMISKGDELHSKAESVRAAGKAKQQELHDKLKEITEALQCYSSTMDPLLERVKELEKQTAGIQKAG